MAPSGAPWGRRDHATSPVIDAARSGDGAGRCPRRELIWASGLHCPHSRRRSCACHDVMTSMSIFWRHPSANRRHRHEHARQGVPHTPADDRRGVPHRPAVHDPGKCGPGAVGCFSRLRVAPRSVALSSSCPHRESALDDRSHPPLTRHSNQYSNKLGATARCGGSMQCFSQEPLPFDKLCGENLPLVVSTVLFSQIKFPVLDTAQ